jgi:hypothetical protein
MSEKGSPEVIWGKCIDWEQIGQAERATPKTGRISNFILIVWRHRASYVVLSSV